MRHLFLTERQSDSQLQLSAKYCFHPQRAQQLSAMRLHFLCNICVESKHGPARNAGAEPVVRPQPGSLPGPPQRRPAAVPQGRVCGRLRLGMPCSALEVSAACRHLPMLLCVLLCARRACLIPVSSCVLIPHNSSCDHRRMHRADPVPCRTPRASPRTPRRSGATASSSSSTPGGRCSAPSAA